MIQVDKRLMDYESSCVLAIVFDEVIPQKIENLIDGHFDHYPNINDQHMKALDKKLAAFFTAASDNERAGELKEVRDRTQEQRFADGKRKKGMAQSIWAFGAEGSGYITSITSPPSSRPMAKKYLNHILHHYYLLSDRMEYAFSQTEYLREFTLKANCQIKRNDSRNPIYRLEDWARKAMVAASERAALEVGILRYASSYR